MAKPKAEPLSVVAAVQRDLAAIAERDSGLAESGLAASALSLAEAMDNPDNSATSKSMCAKALSDTLAQLRELAPDEKKEDRVDELHAKRDQRRKGASAAAN